MSRSEGTPSSTPAPPAPAPADNIVAKVAIRVPPFWPEQPAIWFAQLESQFANAGINADATKFNTIVGSMDGKMLTQVSDAVLHPPDEAKYDNLKRCIIERFSDSEQRKMTKMLSELELGDKKPSQLYNELKQLGGTNVTEDFLITIWLQRLPIHVRRICASVQGDKKQLPAVADEIMDCGHSQVNSIAVKNSEPNSVADGLEKKIDELTKAISALHQSGNFGQRYRSRSRSAASKCSETQDSQSSGDNVSSLCYYHRRFGSNARKCRSPCNFQNPKN